MKKVPSVTDWTKPFDLTGQRILLVGAAGGMGRATARICASLGATMVLADIVDASDLVQQLAGAERGHTFQRCDGRDRSAVEALVGGLESLDTLVVCSGYYPPEDWQSDDWASALHEVMDANLVGPMNFTRAALGVMKPRGKGRIILVGSIAAHTGGSHVNSPIHYAGAKAAIHTTVRWLAKRAAPEVLVNGVAPGITDTPMVKSAKRSVADGFPIPRFAQPEEIAWPIAFLCSPGASYICGAILDVNGGAYMH